MHVAAQTPVRKEADFHRWLNSQAAALRARRANLVDWEGLAEELEAMGARERRELVAHLRNLLAHLLKWKFQARRRSEASWKRSIVVSRQELSELLEDSPSLRNIRSDFVVKAYKQARLLAGTEMKLDKRHWDSLFPKNCPWTFDELIDEDFFPSQANGRNGRK